MTFTLDTLKTKSLLKADKALALVKLLNEDPMDDWTYKAETLGSGFYVVNCYDEAGYYQGPL